MTPTGVTCTLIQTAARHGPMSQCAFSGNVVAARCSRASSPGSGRKQRHHTPGLRRAVALRPLRLDGTRVAGTGLARRGRGAGRGRGRREPRSRQCDGRRARGSRRHGAGRAESECGGHVVLRAEGGRADSDDASAGHSTRGQRALQRRCTGAATGATMRSIGRGGPMTGRLQVRLLGPFDVSVGGSSVGPRRLAPTRAARPAGPAGERRRHRRRPGRRPVGRASLRRVPRGFWHTYVSTWRKALAAAGADRVETVGNRLPTPPRRDGERPAAVRPAGPGRAPVGSPRAMGSIAARTALRQALDLWRGPVLADLAELPVPRDRRPAGPRPPRPGGRGLVPRGPADRCRGRRPAGRARRPRAACGSISRGGSGRPEPLDVGRAVLRGPAARRAAGVRGDETSARGRAGRRPVSRRSRRCTPACCARIPRCASRRTPGPRARRPPLARLLRGPRPRGGRGLRDPPTTGRGW